MTVWHWLSVELIVVAFAAWEIFTLWRERRQKARAARQSADPPG